MGFDCERKVPRVRAGKRTLNIIHWTDRAGEPVDFSQYAGLRLVVTGRRGGTLPVSGVKFEGNAVSFVISKSNSRPGRFTATISDASTFTEDVDFIEFVDRSAKEDLSLPADQELCVNEMTVSASMVVPAGGGGIPDAPEDGQLYGRKDGGWTAVAGGGGGGIPEAPADGSIYGRGNGGWKQAAAKSELDAKVSRELHEADINRIDETLAGISEAVEGKAAREEITAIEARVGALENGKFDMPGTRLSDMEMYGGYWHNTSGKFIPSAQYRCTPKLPIDGDRSLSVTVEGVSALGIRYVYFDAAGNFAGTAISVAGTSTPPAKAVYAGVNITLSAYGESLFGKIRVVGITYEVVGNLINSTAYDRLLSRGGVSYDSGSVFRIEGASFATTGNGWFETACARLGVTAQNNAVAGTHISDVANAMYNSVPGESERLVGADLETFDVLVLMFTHDIDVNESVYIKENFRDYSGSFSHAGFGLVAVAWDYVIKRYRDECYKRRTAPGSRWYNTKHGKPDQIVVMSHWHDARTIYGDSIRKFCAKWRLPLITLDENIGFTKNMPMVMDDGASVQVSTFYGTGNNETIGGVDYGWHPATGQNAEIQKKMASIFANQIRG